jgi:hypothetical protein
VPVRLGDDSVSCRQRERRRSASQNHSRRIRLSRNLTRVARNDIQEVEAVILTLDKTSQKPVLDSRGIDRGFLNRRSLRRMARRQVRSTHAFLPTAAAGSSRAEATRRHADTAHARDHTHRRTA